MFKTYCLSIDNDFLKHITHTLLFNTITMYGGGVRNKITGTPSKKFLISLAVGIKYKTFYTMFTEKKSIKVELYSLFL